MFEPQKCTIESIKWNGEDRVEIHTEGGIWCGAKRKDFWNADKDWESILVPGALLRLWTIQWSIILGMEVWEDGRGWVSVWCMANDFKTKAENEASKKAYVGFIESEGVLIASLIDQLKTLKEIDELISKDHTGNTYAWALSIGIQKATNRVHADVIKRFHNLKYGVTDGDGLVNPAVMSINVDGKT